MSYQDKALLTENIDFQSISKRLQSGEILQKLEGLMGDSINDGEYLDSLKKYIFYGKDNGEGVDNDNLVTVDVQGARQKVQDNKVMRLIHAIVGLATESGELLEALSEYLFYDKKELDETNLMEEAGDVMWYLAQLCDALSTSFEVVQDINIKKLQKRFPDKFNNEDAIGRDHDQERKVMDALIGEEGRYTQDFNI